MAYLTKPRGKIVRRLGVSVFGNPKYQRILKAKPNGPGIAPGSRNRKKKSDYGTQLLEKQKVRFHYGLSEKQFRNTFYKAKRKSGNTGEVFIQMLESRLDNTIYRLGWAVSREQARQTVSHKHVLINGRYVNIPSQQLKPGDVIEIIRKKRIQDMIRQRIATVSPEKSPWLTADNDNLTGVYTTLPDPVSVPPPGELQAIVEFYSR